MRRTSGENRWLTRRPNIELPVSIIRIAGRFPVYPLHEKLLVKLANEMYTGPTFKYPEKAFYKPLEGFLFAFDEELAVS